MKESDKKKAIIYTKPNFVFPAIFAGLMALGYRVVWRNGAMWTNGCGEDCDLVVVHGMGEKARQIRDHYIAKARAQAVALARANGLEISEEAAETYPVNFPVFVVDLGYYARNQGYWQMGRDALNSLPTRLARWPQDRAKQIGLIAGKPSKKRSKRVIICEQKPGDAQHPFKSQAQVSEYTNTMIEEVGRIIPGAEIEVRPHPMTTSEELPPLSEAIQGAAALVTYNSTSALEAFVQGVPVIADKSAFYAEAVGNRSQSEIQAFLNRCAYGQWTAEEFETGLPFQYYLDELECPTPSEGEGDNEDPNADPSEGEGGQGEDNVTED